MVPNVPSRIDKAAFDRVLRRAAELQSSGHEIGEAGMTEEEVLALGQEVGLPAAQLRQALMEERVRATPLGDPGFLDRLVAPAEFQAERVVQGTPEMVSAALTRWLEQYEHMVPQRAAIDRITYEPMHSLASAMRRAGAIFDPSRGKPYLDKADLLTAVITPLEDGYCHVTLGATLRKRRSSYFGGAAAVGSFGVAGGAIVSVIGGVSLVPMIPLLAGIGLGLLVARAYRPVAARVRIGLERALDGLEQNPALSQSAKSLPPRSAVLGREVGDAVREFSREVRKALDK